MTPAQEGFVELMEKRAGIGIDIFGNAPSSKNTVDWKAVKALGAPMSRASLLGQGNRMRLGEILEQDKVDPRTAVQKLRDVASTGKVTPPHAVVPATPLDRLRNLAKRVHWPRL